MDLRLVGDDGGDVKSNYGIAWEGGGVDDGYRGSKIVAPIPDDKNPRRSSIDFDPSGGSTLGTL
ncbi:hypothetical protein BHM03_00034722 [Ensete ventricosum]|nr:hypothetical protein BHM03_00034722 [Ensete ventricosum]